MSGNKNLTKTKKLRRIFGVKEKKKMKKNPVHGVKVQNKRQKRKINPVHGVKILIKRKKNNKFNKILGQKVWLQNKNKLVAGMLLKKRLLRVITNQLGIIKMPLNGIVQCKRRSSHSKCKIDQKESLEEPQEAKTVSSVGKRVILLENVQMRKCLANLENLHALSAAKKVTKSQIVKILSRKTNQPDQRAVLNANKRVTRHLNVQISKKIPIKIKIYIEKVFLTGKVRNLNLMANFRIRVQNLISTRIKQIKNGTLFQFQKIKLRNGALNRILLKIMRIKNGVLKHILKRMV